jgi:hypothetical protein
VTQPRRPRIPGAAAAVALLALMVSLVACSDDPVAPATTAPAGYTVMSDAKEGFALAVPADWTRIPLSQNPDTFNKDANALRLANPKLASILNQARVLGQSGGKFMAVNPEGKASVNLTVDKPKEKTLQAVVDASIGGLNRAGATRIAQEAATVDGRPAIKLNFVLPVVTDDGTIQTDEVQHYILDGSKAYILSMLATPPEVASTMVSTLRIR